VSDVYVEFVSVFANAEYFIFFIAQPFNGVDDSMSQ